MQFILFICKYYESIAMKDVLVFDTQNLNLPNAEEENALSLELILLKHLVCLPEQVLKLIVQ